MKTIEPIAAIVLGLLCQVSNAQVVVIANTSTNISEATSEQVINVFLGKSDSLSGVSGLQAVDQAEGNSNRDKFYNATGNKTPSQIKAYWARIIFSGKGKPPQTLQSDAEVKKFVAANTAAIGYISKDPLIQFLYDGCERHQGCPDARDKLNVDTVFEQLP